MGLLFVGPWILGFLLYEIYPLTASFYFSLTRYDIIRPPVFLGFENYIDLFTGDATFPKVLWNTLYYVGFGVPFGIGFAFLVANLLNAKIVGRAFFRGVIYLPSIVPAVASAMVWQFLMSVQYGAINGLLRTLDLPVIPFLSNPSWAKPSLILVSVWAQGAAVVIFLAALQDVPRSLYEAATVDGANGWQKFLNITIPLTSPIILFNLSIGFIYGVRSFSVAWLRTVGGPLNSTEFLLVHLYRNAFQYFRMGKASAIAWVMFVIIVIFTVIMFRSSNRWVHYGGDS
jgi:multiple sugar transport system permease protein